MRYALTLDRSIKPKDLQRVVVESVFFLRKDIDETQHLLDGMGDAKRLKRWLTAQRQEMEADAALAEWLDMQPFDDWHFGR